MSPVPGIAAAFDRDSDLARHPSVLVYHDFVSKGYIREAFVGHSTNPLARPSLEADCEILEVPELGVRGVRLWAVVGINEKIVGWWVVAEPQLAGVRARGYQRAYGEGYTHLFVRYLLRIGEDVAAGAGILAGKLPGMTGTYDVYSESIEPPIPRFSAYATWEARMFQGYPNAAGEHPLGIYYYGVRAPGVGGAPGVPASIGVYDGRGTPGGTPMTTGVLKPGVWHCIEQEVKLNTVKNVALRNPSSADPPAQLEEMLANANSDGELRVWLDGVLVYESTAVAFRGLDRVRIQSIPFVNIYQGGVGTYPKAPEHYDLCAMVASTQYVGPPKRMQIQAAAPAVNNSLSALAASMNAGTWAELIATDIDAVVGVGHAGNSEVAIPYANSAPWCPIRKRIVIVGADHGDLARHMEYDDATNRFLHIGMAPGGVHHYQHVAVDPYAGDIYFRLGSGRDLYRYTGTEWRLVTTIPVNVAEVATVALCWWSGPFPGAGGHGVLTVYSGSEATISVFDPTTGSWLPNVLGVLPGQRGYYHVVSAYSSRHNCLVYGGGNVFQGEGAVERQLWRLNADLSRTRMPDAPHRVGIYGGMNLVSDTASGNIIALGFGEAWELNPSGAGSWTQMTGSRAPPAGLLVPNAPPNAVISCDATSLGVVVYIDALRNRQPECRMWVYKSGGVGAAPNYDGSWWNPSEAGWGIHCAHQGDVIFAAWFTHDAGGKAWYLSMTLQQTGPNTFAGTLIRTAGPPLAVQPFDSSQVRRFEEGSASLTFSDSNTGTFAYTVNGISQSKSISRFMFGPLPSCGWGGTADLALATNYQGLWWAAGGMESGWGLALTHHGDIIFAMWFTYDFAGSPLPLSGALKKVDTTTYSGALIKTSGPAFSAVPFNPDAVTRTEVGTATLTFAHGNAATFSYDVNLDGQIAGGSKTIERLVFRAPGTICR